MICTIYWNISTNSTNSTNFINSTNRKTRRCGRWGKPCDPATTRRATSLVTPRMPGRIFAKHLPAPAAEGFVRFVRNTRILVQIARILVLIVQIVHFDTPGAAGS